MKIEYVSSVTKRDGSKVTVSGTFHQTSFNRYTMQCMILFDHFADGSAVGTDSVEIVNFYVEQ